MKDRLLKADRQVDFKSKQDEFAAYIRDPENNPVPADVKEQRMVMYRELFFNNIEGFLSGNFPVLRKILDDRQWFALVRTFLQNTHASRRIFHKFRKSFWIICKMNAIARRICPLCWNWRIMNGWKWP